MIKNIPGNKKLYDTDVLFNLKKNKDEKNEPKDFLFYGADYYKRYYDNKNEE